MKTLAALTLALSTLITLPARAGEPYHTRTELVEKSDTGAAERVVGRTRTADECVSVAWELMSMRFKSGKSHSTYFFCRAPVNS